jgi:ATP-dependent DNA helicase RecG
VTDGKSPEGLHKLEVLAGTVDGFQIAEEDLRLRGPGEVLGTRQSGDGAMRFPEFLSDHALVREARARAREVINQDPALSAYPELRVETGRAERD